MNEITKVNKVLEQIVQDIENNNLDERTYELDSKKINIILDKDLNSFILNYFEAYLQLEFKPLYEGPINQKH